METKMVKVLFINKQLSMNILKSIHLMDSKLYLAITSKVVSSIIYIMACVYTLIIMDKYPHIKNFTTEVVITTLMETSDLVISCILCNSLVQKCLKIANILNAMNTRDMTDREFREWLTFATVMRNTRTFGFTIGGFAALNKSTLIKVNKSSDF